MQESKDPNSVTITYAMGMDGKTYTIYNSNDGVRAFETPHYVLVGDFELKLRLVEKT